MAKNQKSFKGTGDENCEGSATRGTPARGRPRLAVAMSDAERAKRYRDNKRLHVVPIKRDDHCVTFNRPTVIGPDVLHNAADTRPSYGMLESRLVLLNAGNIRLSDDLQDARDQIAVLKKALRDAGIVTRHEKSKAGQAKSRR